MRAFAISRSAVKIMPAGMTTKELLRWNRHSVSRAMLIGLFVVPLPIPSQMLLAALLASLLRANLPLAVSLVWVSNPLTILPIAWFCTVLGCSLLNQDPAFLFSLEFTSISELLEQTWRPLFLGALCCGTVLGLAGYHITQFYWRSSVLRRWRNRSKTLLEARNTRSLSA
ncbi:MAG: DUF2062 domain-containing protein [Gammaproteobacteria bacterium]|nr:DUF2062 domain-containing protein [Gammaproteobacteria bacterium]MBT8151564.1 DUF2062 domain-containing protein [Gammaproteobacteria bacterium]NND40423.1 DUF2062 domain-containing protein [Pseudomonadales bacterium]NNM12354.1 DUF2062 domain-containing protein [Pseudomonadales bacterium]RZV50800.1 MAG: DUF2062 domain-containing protein [Pseudomonadales bacterium]